MEELITDDNHYKRLSMGGESDKQTLQQVVVAAGATLQERSAGGRGNIF